MAGNTAPGHPFKSSASSVTNDSDRPPEGSIISHLGSSANGALSQEIDIVSHTIRPADSPGSRVRRTPTVRSWPRRSSIASKVGFDGYNRCLSSVGREGRFRPFACVRVVGVDQDPNRNALAVVPDYCDSVVEDTDPKRR